MTGNDVGSKAANWSNLSFKDLSSGDMAELLFLNQSIACSITDTSNYMSNIEYSHRSVEIDRVLPWRKRLMQGQRTYLGASHQFVGVMRLMRSQKHCLQNSFAGTAFGRIMHDRVAVDRHSCDTPAAHRHSAFARGFCQCSEFRASHPVQ